MSCKATRTCIPANVHRTFDACQALTSDPLAAAVLTLASMLENAPSTAVAPKSLNVRDAAKYLDVGQSCIRDLIRRGLLKYQRIGKGRGMLRIRPADLADYQEQSVPRVGPKQITLQQLRDLK